MKIAFAAAAAILALTASGAALAQTSPSRALYICSDSAATRIAFAKEFGADAKFVSAAQVRATKAGWATPRCITAREHAKLMRPAPAMQAANTVKVPG